MTPITPSTELDAVNVILKNDGEAPVSTLEEGGFSEASDALSTLREVSRYFQEEGWAFNTDYDRRFTPDINGEIILPQDTLWVRPGASTPSHSFVERGRRLYDMERHTSEFLRPVHIDICQAYPFEDLPSSARSLITIRAARVYQARATGSPQQNSFTEADEWRAQATFKKADYRARPRGFLRNPANVRFMRRRP